VKRLLFCLLPLLPITLQASGILSLPVQQVEADQVTFDEKSVHLKGNVKVVHEIGELRCEEGTLVLDKKHRQEGLGVDHISLKKNVLIAFSNGSSLQSDEGEINCITLETVFRAEPPRKVIYISQAEQGTPPLKASGRALKALIATSEGGGYALKSLKGEGAVNIEYLKKEEHHA